MARPKTRKTAPRRRSAGKTTLPASIASAVIARLSTATGSGRPGRIAAGPAKRKRPGGALSHPAARGKTAGTRPTLAAAVASAVSQRLAAAPRKRAGKPRASLAAAVASAVSRGLRAPSARRR